MRQRWIVSGHDSAFSAHQCFRRSEGEDLGVAKLPHWLALRDTSECVGSIEHQLQFMAAGDFAQSLNVAGIAVEMHAENGAGALRDPAFDIGGIEQPGVGVDFREYWSESIPDRGVSAGEEGKAR